MSISPIAYGSTDADCQVKRNLPPPVHATCLCRFSESAPEAQQSFQQQEEAQVATVGDG